MKSILLFLTWMFLITATSQSQTVKVRFQVHNPPATPVYAFGSWTNWMVWPGEPMTAAGDGYYAVTITLPADSVYEFLYVSGSTPAKELLNPAWPCTNGNGEYTNRVLHLGNKDTTICYDWQSCNTCTAPVNDIAVTFQVQNPGEEPVYIFGSWSNWINWPGNPMTSIGNGYYAGTVFLKTGTNYEYLFVKGATPVKEALDPAWICTNGNGEYTNRVLNTGGGHSTICYTWGTCNTCFVPTNDIQVTFQVKNPDSLPVYVFGSWTNWGNWPGTEMTSVGNNLYQTTISIKSNQSIEYLFVNGKGPTKEVLDPAWTCTNGNSQYTNHLNGLGIHDTTFCYTWSSCQSCNSASDNQIETTPVRITLTRNGLIVHDNLKQESLSVEIFDAMGKKIKISQEKMVPGKLIEARLQVNTIYIVRLRSGERTAVYKGVVLE